MPDSLLTSRQGCSLLPDKSLGYQPTHVVRLLARAFIDLDELFQKRSHVVQRLERAFPQCGHATLSPRRTIWSPHWLHSGASLSRVRMIRMGTEVVVVPCREGAGDSDARPWSVRDEKAVEEM